MAHITRMWLGFAAVSAGLIHLALVISSPLPLAAVLLALGFAEVGWGVLTFARDSLFAPAAARVGAIVPVVLWALLVVVSTLVQNPAIVEPLTFMPMAIATVFEIFIAVVLTLHLRRTAAGKGTDVAASAPPPAGRYLLALFAGAMIAGAMTTPALAATEAGKHAQPHGAHGSEVVPVEDGADLSELVPEHEQH